MALSYFVMMISLYKGPYRPGYCSYYCPLCYGDVWIYSDVHLMKLNSTFAKREYQGKFNSSNFSSRSGLEYHGNKKKSVPRNRNDILQHDPIYPRVPSFRGIKPSSLNK